MDFKTEFERRKAAIKNEKEGLTLVEETPEVNSQPKESVKPSDTVFNANKALLSILFVSMFLNIISLTVISDWFDFMGSTEYAVWKINNVKGATHPNFKEKEKIYKYNIKKMLKESK